MKHRSLPLLLLLGLSLGIAMPAEATAQKADTLRVLNGQLFAVGDDQGLPGVTVYDKIGGVLGSVTDIDGYYRIVLPDSVRSLTLTAEFSGFLPRTFTQQPGSKAILALQVDPANPENLIACIFDPFTFRSTIPGGIDVVVYNGPFFPTTRTVVPLSW